MADKEPGAWEDRIGAFLGKYGFVINWSDSPGENPAAIGCQMQSAQLCQGNMIAAQRQIASIDTIMHEAGHGMVLRDGGTIDDEHRVEIETRYLLKNLVVELLRESYRCPALTDAERTHANEVVERLAANEVSRG